MPKNQKAPKNQKSTKKPKLAFVITLTIIAICAIIGILGFVWYGSSLSGVYSNGCEYNQNPDGSITTSDDAPAECTVIIFTIDQGDSAEAIATALEDAGLIKNRFAFRLYAKLQGVENQFKAGSYPLLKSMSVAEIAAYFVAGEGVSNVFSFTILPGETLMDIEANLAELGYSAEEISAAFSKTYHHSVLSSKPDGVSLEGYLYGDTYEFYKGEKVENIILRALDEMASVVKNDNLEADFKKQGLTLHEGITLASIVQRESTADEMAGVAQVFLTRLRQGMLLGSDVTTQYALDLADPNREIYTDNAAALAIDSPYNTRKYAGLPPGAISSPSRAALSAVAHPADSSYLYFLTGDDGKMYYSYTESEHRQNAAKYCKELCNVSL